MKRTRQSVPARETGAVRGDGGGRRSMNASQGGGRNIMAGRHSVNQQTARPGSIRPGQGARTANGVGTGYNQKTAARPEWNSARPFSPNAKDTSADAERFIREAPDPFKDSQTTPNIPAPANRGARFSGNNATEGRTRWLQPQNRYSILNGTDTPADHMAAVGYKKNDTKGDWNIISGYPTRSGRQAGMPGTNTPRTASSRESARVRQTGF